MTTLLLDSDIIAYAAAASKEKHYKWAPDVESVAVGDLEEACAEAKDVIDRLINKLDASEVIVCMSCASADGFRRAILPTYKANRGVKPQLLEGVKQWMRDEYPTYERPTLEADDIMGILSTHPSIVKGKRIIVSIDKDMESIPGLLFNPQKDNKPRLISPEKAQYRHFLQTLTGDATDNYTGCPGIGPIKAERWLSTPELGCSWTAVVAAYESKGLTEEDALLQARVARICHHTDYDFTKKEVKLWTP